METSLKDRLLEYFEFFSLKFSGGTCKVKTEVDRFLVLLSKQQDIKALGDWFAWWYVAFQFEYWVSLKTQMDGRYPANWIFGQKALKRWNDRDQGNWQFYVQSFLNRTAIEQPQEFLSSDVETGFEGERKRFFNTDLGLLHCQQWARYSASSPSCMVCKNKKECKKLWS